MHKVGSEVLGNIVVAHRNSWCGEECQIATEESDAESLCGGLSDSK
jgi:hypothetical protein